MEPLSAAAAIATVVQAGAAVVGLVGAGIVVRQRQVQRQSTTVVIQNHAPFVEEEVQTDEQPPTGRAGRHATRLQNER